MSNNDVLLTAQNVSKKFCRNLRRSLWYGIKDIYAEISCLDEEKKFLRKDEFWALKDISFEIKRGESVGLIGHNGAGKSTLLKLLSGIIKPDTGEICINGQVGALIELGAGFNPILTGRENIYINAAILGIPRSHVDSFIDEIIDFSELHEFIDTPVQSYSSGMRVRLGFAVTVFLKPDILFIDEVLAVGDFAFQQKCLNSLKDKISSGMTIILVSHNIRVIQYICNRIILLNHGQIETIDDSTTVAERYLELMGSKINETIQTSIEHAQQAKSAKIYTTSVKLLSTNGKFKTNDKLTLAVSIKASQPLEKFALGITIWTKDNIKIATLTSQQIGFIASQGIGDKTFICEVNPLNLLPGQYIIRGGIYDAFAGFPYDQWGWDQHFVSFRVISGRSPANNFIFYEGLGIVDMSFQWIEQR